MATTTIFKSNDPVTIIASGALTQGMRLVYAGAGVFSAAGLTDRADAVTAQDIADGEEGQGYWLSGNGTNYGLADGTGVTALDTVYGAAAGVLSSTQGTGAFAEGVALTTAGADEIFEWRYKPELTAGA